MSQSQNTQSPNRFDAVVVGAGVTGLYALERLLKLGLTVKLVEAGTGVGGTWYWNRYPKCRFDSESPSYGYFHDKELLQDWDWSEEYASAPEIERYFNHAVDHWGIRDHIQFNTIVQKADLDEANSEWALTLSTGEVVLCKYFVPAVGLLSATYTPNWPGFDSYKGEVYITSRWPKEEVDFTGKRVAVIGTGATGVQVIPPIAEVAGSLTVFQRTPNWCSPLNNRPYSAEEMAEIKGRYDEMRAQMDIAWMAFDHYPDPRKTFEVTEEERLQKFEELYRSGGLRKVSESFADLALDEAANKAWSDFLASKIRQRVKDPVIAEKLIPKDHAFGAKRPPMETNYYEVYNQENVELVELPVTPIVRFTEAGIETSEREFEFDAVVLATGFDAVTGAVLDLNITGRDGEELRDTWREGPVTLFGANVPRFPNLFIAGGPHVGAGNVPRGTEFQVDFIVAQIAQAEDLGARSVEVTEEAASEFLEHVQEAVGNMSKFFSYSKNWYTGGNIPGKPLVYTQYPSGIPEYGRRMREIVAKGFPGLKFEGASSSEPIPAKQVLAESRS